MNKVILTGTLVKDPVVKATPNGTKVVCNTIAVKKNHKLDEGETDCNFINFVAWEKNAEYIKQYGHKGDRIELSGVWQVRYYETNTGENKRVDELIVDSVGIYSKREKNGPQEENVTYKDAMKNAIDKNELPF